MFNKRGNSNMKKIWSFIVILMMAFSMTPTAFAAGSNPVSFVGAWLTTTNHLTETNPLNQISTPGAVLTDNNNVPSGLQTIDISIDKNIISDTSTTALAGVTIYNHNKSCITLRDMNTGSDAPIDIFRLGATDGTGVYKQHIYFDVTLVSGHSYQIRIDTSLTANNGLTLAENTTANYSNPICVNFSVPSASPTVSSAGTSSDGSKVIIAFDKAMSDPTGQQGQFTVHTDSVTDVVTGATLNSDPTKIELNLTTAITNGQSVTVDYTTGAITSADGGVLAAFNGLNVTNNVQAVVDQSSAIAALSPSGSKLAGSSFGIAITGAKDTSGASLNGSVAVTVTNGASTVYSGSAVFTAGAATVTIPASATATSITTAGNYNLTIGIAGVTPKPIVPVTITAATQISSTLSTATIDQALSKGATRTITVTLRDNYGNPMAGISKNMNTMVTITNNYSATAESYSVDGSVVTASGITTISKSKTPDSNGQYTVSVVMPGTIDPGDCVSIQIAQNISTFIGSQFSYSEYIATPQLISATTLNANNILLTMDNALLGTQGDPNAFSISGAASNPRVTNVSVSGSSVILTLDACIAYGETTQVSYAKSGTNNLTNGAQVANFSNQSITNNVPLIAAAPVVVNAVTNIQGTVITLVFDKSMAVLPSAPAGFSVAVNGTDNVISAVSQNTDNTKIELCLTTAINNGQTATVSYTPGSITALDGGVLEGFTARAVTNSTLRDGYITTLLGDGTSSSTGDNGPASLAKMARSIYGSSVVDNMGNIYFIDSAAYKVREIAAVTHTQFGINMTAGNVYTVAGTGTSGGYASGDEGKSAITVKINNAANGIAVDPAGNLYFADSSSNIVREVANTTHTQYGISMTAGYIYRIAGVGGGSTSANYTTGAQEEGVAARTAHLANPYGLIFDQAGNLYIIDYNNNRIRKMDLNGTISTVVGTGSMNPTADSGPATSFNIRPTTMAFDSIGNLFIGDGLCRRIYKMDTGGNITTYAGKLFPSGSTYTVSDADQGPGSLLTQMGFLPSTLVFDNSDNLYVAEGTWDRVRKIGADGSVTIVAGFGYAAGITNVFNGDNLPATEALLNAAVSASLDKWGNMYIVDNQSYRIRFVKNPQVVVTPPPVVTSAQTTDATHINLVFSRALLGTAGDPLAFTLSGIASNPTVSSAAISGSNVTLTFTGGAIAYGDNIKLNYTKTGTNSAQGTSNLTSVSSFSNQSVTNNVPKSMTGIAVTTPPTKTAYVDGQNFDSTGMVVTATYDNSTTAPVTGYTVSPAAVTVGTTQVTITLGSFSATTPITVSASTPSGTDHTSSGSTSSSDGDTTLTPVIDASGNAKEALTDTQVSDMLKNISDNSSVMEIKLDVTAEIKQANVELTKDSLSQIANSQAEGIKLNTSIGQVLFDKEAVNAINGQTTGNISLSVAKVDTNTLSGEAKTIIGDRPVVELKVTSDNKTISTFGGGNVTVSIPYTLKAGENPENIIIYYINAQGIPQAVKASSCDKDSGTVVFKTNHFSKYAIGYNEVVFTDTINNWANNSINYLVARGIINGVGNDQFAPNNNITRAEFVKILAGIEDGIDLTKANNVSFADVQSGKWYSQSINWAVENKIAKGYSSRKFGLNDSITREQMAVMIYNVAKVIGYDLSDTNKSIKFADDDKISSYAKDAVSAMQKAGIINGKSNNLFDPQGKATRAEAAKMISILLKSMVE